VLDPRPLEQRELLAERGYRRRAVGGVEDAPRVRLEGDQGGRSLLGRGRGDRAPDDVEVTEVNAVEAADRERNGPDRVRRQP
jgi:hypothetical protein